MESARRDGAPVLTMTGDIDVATEQDWRRRGNELLDAHPDLTDIVIDMARVTFLDSRGMAVLIHLHGKASARGGKLTLLAVPPRVAKALGVAGLDQVFQVEPA
jgi:anti-sigma B factor antagonist